MNSSMISFKNLLIVLLILFGIILSVYLVQRSQVFKSKASNHAAQALTVIQENDDSRDEVAPIGESGVPVFNLEGGSTVKIKLKADPNILNLFEE